MALHEYMKRVVEQREVLSRSQARALLDLVLAGSTDADRSGSPHSLQLAALLGAIAARGETASELAGFADAMLAAAVPVPLEDTERERLVDTCGTGGDDTGTFNISTAAALVAAAAGADAGSRMMVAKHGNRAVTHSAARPMCSKPSAFPSLSPPPPGPNPCAATALPSSTLPACILP